ncbi:molybdenum ABC transporter ATP-binding protein [Thalassotalea sp. HSM 43]|uniref:molybdenum ABC transporter ATP-binding protein n=1 Tax=Thalassotalea sp. HSM 43 TaxID=2552945 RepID=UPI001080BFE3|nr:molybdenum ABC transporter ATP-binding protein [Thalassotalea sp. HSM 43]QBY03627.1 molybdenum ABC transporter ATP-binding protein [Thalassotalea sp. HSM 43]
MLAIDISLSYPGFKLDFAQHIKVDGITGILGHSGSGKTSLLRIISGLNNDADGQITFSDQVMQDDSTFIAADKRQIGFVFQDARLFPHLNVEQNLAFALKRSRNKGLSLATISKLTKIDALLSRSVDKLSAGEKQRVALARALLSAPKLLLLDEPLSSLDNKSRGEMITLLKDIHQQLSLPMLYVSHSVAEIQQLADDVLVMEQGKVIQMGHVHHVINQLDQSIASSFSQQTSLSLKVQQHLINFGLTQLALIDDNSHDQQGRKQHINLFSNVINQPLGSFTRAYVMASDISITLEKSENSSINNIIAGNISEIRRLSRNLALVYVDVLSNRFAVNISRYSVEKLNLQIGSEVYIQFKASAIRHL